MTPNTQGGDFIGDRECVTHHACDCMQRKAGAYEALSSACKQWRQATESRLKMLDSRGEAAKSMLPADRALCEAIDRVDNG